MSASPDLDRPHPGCWHGDHYGHDDCHIPSGRTCLDCDEPAGTPWGPYWCPDHDVVRLTRIGERFRAISDELRGQR